MWASRSYPSNSPAEDGGDKQADENNTSSPLRGRSLPKEDYFRADQRAESDSEGESGHQFLNFRFVNYGFTDASSLPFDLRDVILLVNG
jgi:hypothetical protein